MSYGLYKRLCELDKLQILGLPGDMGKQERWHRTHSLWGEETVAGAGPVTQLIPLHRLSLEHLLAWVLLEVDPRLGCVSNSLFRSVVGARVGAWGSETETDMH